MKLSTILDQINNGSIALPEFQRGFVWNRDQVRGLMTSLYRGHPVGSLLVWETRTDQVTDHARGDGKLTAGTVKLLLDGQQRITSLYGIICGQAPQFFEGNAKAFTDLYFNLEDETFAFYAPTRMDNNPYWINVTELMKEGPGSFGNIIYTNPDLTKEAAGAYNNRLLTVYNIREREFHIEEVSGADKTVEEVVEIFNKVNSGGTKLSKGDLALARICAAWPEARSELNSRLNGWQKAGFNFKLDWLLRCITSVLTNESLFSGLKDVSTDRFKKGLQDSEKSIDTLLNVIASRLGLDHHRVLGSIYAFPLMTRYLDQRGGHFPNHQERDKLLYWYIHTMLWGRYSSSIESNLRKDLAAISGSEGSLDPLIEQLRQNRGDLRIAPGDFNSWSVTSRFYPMLYLLTRVCGARDWEDDVMLSKHMLGRLASLEVHHIFPKSKLYEKGYERAEVNAISNFAFLTKETNLKVSNRDPEEYFAHYETKHPGTLAAQWIPTDPKLWKYENYPDFLAARRELLAQAANQFLDSLCTGTIPEPDSTENLLEREQVIVPCNLASADEKALQACNQWVTEQQLPAGEPTYNLTEGESGGAIVFDLAWPDGLQPGYSQPVALLIDKNSETEAASHAGFRFFTDVDRFKTYVRQEILALNELTDEPTDKPIGAIALPEASLERRLMLSS